MNLLQYLGVAASQLSCMKLIDELDSEGTGLMSQREFLLCMRKSRDGEINKMKDAIAHGDKDGSGTLSASEIRETMQMLGFLPTEAAIRDSCEDAGLDPETDELSLNELWALLQAYRAREGFSKEDLQEIEGTFSRYSALDFLSIEDLDKALRYMGFALPFQTQRSLTYQVDSDMSGQLDLKEFQKMIRLCGEKEIQEIKEAFAAYSVANTSHDLMGVGDAIALLGDLGYVDDGCHAPKIGDDDIKPSRRGKTYSVDICDLVHVMTRSSKDKRSFFRDHNGFGFQEVEIQKVDFHEADEDKNGVLTHSELFNLLGTIFPDLSNNSVLRAVLEENITALDVGHTGSLNFLAFLTLKRKCCDVQINAQIDKEKRATEETGFTQSEIYDFRELFMGADTNGDEELSLPEFKNLIAGICPMGDKNSSAMTRIFHEVVRGQHKEPDAKIDHADFPEFLLAMHCVLETNFGGIREKIAAPHKSVTLV